MLRSERKIGLVTSLAIALVMAFTALSLAAYTGYEPGQIIVKFTPEVGTVMAQSKDGLISVGIASLDMRMYRYRVSHIEPLFPHKTSELGHIYQLDFDPSYDAKAVALDFAQDENLLYAEPCYLHQICDTPDDPNYTIGLQWFFNTVHAPEAWDIAHGDSSVVIGFVDTGIDKDHPDILANRWFNLGEDANGNGRWDNGDWNLIDDDNNGFVDDFFGWDFQGLYGNPDSQPDEGAALLGTHSAGICCAATNNQLANAGMSWNCLYMTVKVSRDGEELIRKGYQGIQYAADMGADVINLSWTRTNEPSTMEQEIIDSASAKGAIIVAAAGNDLPESAYAPPDTCPRMYPAAYHHVVAVAATDMFDRATSFTYYGTWVDVAAPGNGMYSHLWNDTYGMRSSTSSACALVSGVAALAKVKDPEITSDLFESIVRSTADNIDALNPTYAGWLGGGRLNAYETLKFVSVEDPLSDASHVPGGYTLCQNYPNPFNPTTTIAYRLAKAGTVELRIYNVKGQLVRTLVDEFQPAGDHQATWDGCDAGGRQVASGIYLYQLGMESWHQAKKMVLMR